MEIIKQHLSKNITKSPNRQIKYLVIHYTAGGSSKPGRAQNVYNVFMANNNSSADFAIDDKEVVQLNPDIRNFYCWSVGDGKGKYGVTNKNSISVEMCSNLKKGGDVKQPFNFYFTDETINNTIMLVKYLMKTYNIDKENVIRHYDASRKYCPGVSGWIESTKYNSTDDEWKKFKEKLE